MHVAAGPGRVVAGRYQLQDPIGRGAMGTVWRARDVLLARDVAVKEVRLRGATSDDDTRVLYERTLREARTAARLNHPGVVTVFDVVEADGSPWIVMELVQARSLEQILAEDGPLPVRQAADVGTRLLGALASAHGAGILHRDVKPSNVLLGTDGRAVLTDFGIATLEGDASLTQVGMVMGTPGFTAPERIRGEQATPASDLWSLGATLYAAVQGHGPFDGRGSSLAILAAIANEEAPRSQAAGPLGEVIDGLLRRDPWTRPDAAAADQLLAAAAAAGSRDTGSRDTGSRDTGSRDTGPRDTGPWESRAGAGGNANGRPWSSRNPSEGKPDPRPWDSRNPDAGSPDAGSPDAGYAGHPNAGYANAGLWDGGNGSTGAVPAGSVPTRVDLPGAVGLTGQPHPRPAAPDDLPAQMFPPAPDGQPGWLYPPAPVGQPAPLHPRASPPAPLHPPGPADLPRTGDRPARSAAVRRWPAPEQGPGRHGSRPPRRRTGLLAGLGTIAILGAGILGGAAWAHSGTTLRSYHWYSVPGAATGTTAGFTMEVPDGWRAARRGVNTVLTDPAGTTSVLVRPTTFVAATAPGEARLLADQARLHDTFPGYHRVALRSFLFTGGLSAMWEFSWQKAGTGTLDALDVFFRLSTPAGRQAYILQLSAPPAHWTASKAVFGEILRTFRAHS